MVEKTEDPDPEKLNPWLESLYRKYYPGLRTYVRDKSDGRLSNEETDEIVTSALLVLAGKLADGKFEDRGPAKTKNFLQITVMNLLHTHWRQKARERKDFENWAGGRFREPAGPEETDRERWLEITRAAKDQTMQLLYDCIGRLEEGDQTVLMLYCWCEWKVREIADELEQKQSWVKGRLFRIRKMLRKCLGPNDSRLYFNIPEE